MKKENWSLGKIECTVVTDHSEGFEKPTGHEDTEYYGGYLIAESILKPKDAYLISAAPDMLEALENLENDNKSIPAPIWDMVQKAIAKAKGVDLKGK